MTTPASGKAARFAPRVGVNSNVGRPVQPRHPVTMTRLVSRAAINALTLNESVAPSCPITRSEVPPTQPGIKVPYVPRATDVELAIKAINTIIDIIASEDTGVGIRWLEKERGTQVVRITNPQDDNQWVDVERITYLLMEDQYNGDLWYWELGQSQPPAPTGVVGPIINASDWDPRLMTMTVVTPPKL